MGSNGDSLTVLEWRVRDVMNCKRVTIRPRAAGITKIKGRNQQGKSCSIRALLMALGGAKTLPARPIRDGAETGETEVRLADPLGEKYLITQKITAKGPSLSVKARVEDRLVPWPSPQTFLDDIQGAGIGADPGAFCDGDPATQVKMVLPILQLPVDPRTLDVERAALYKERKAVNQRVTQAKALMDSANAQPLPEAPEQEVSVTALLTELEQAQAQTTANQALRDAAAEAEARALDVELETSGEIAVAEGCIEETKQEIARLQAALAENEKQLALLKADAARRTTAAQQEVEAARRAAEGLQDVDTAGIRLQISTAEETNKAVRARQAEVTRRDGLAQQHATVAQESADLTAKIDAIDQRKADLYAAAKWPVEGMRIEGDDAGNYWLTMHGIPLSECSESQKMKIGMDVCVAGSPRLKLLLFRQGSQMDDDRLALVEAEALAKGYQVIVEIVTKDQTPEDGAFIIEDGSVLEPAA